MTDPEKLPIAPDDAAAYSLQEQMLQGKRRDVVVVTVKMAWIGKWLVCTARMTHDDGTDHDMRWRSTSLAYALDMVGHVARNYPNIKYLQVHLGPAEEGDGDFDGR